MTDNLERVSAEAVAKLAEAETLEAIEELKVSVLGRKGVMQAAMVGLRDVPREDRPAIGKAVNDIKRTLTEAFEARVNNIRDRQDAKGITGLDVTLPGRRRQSGLQHPITRVIDDCVQVFRRLGFVVAEGPDLEDEYHNFDALNTPKDHPSRDIQDTFYLLDGRLLRTQTSPVQIRVMENQGPPIRIVAPGRCYRRDTPDATHTPNFHQIEGLYIDHDVSMADLKGVLLTFAKEMFGEDMQTRVRPHFFPFTEPSVEFDFTCMACQGQGCPVCKHSGWLEIAGAGMVDPNVLEELGIDSEEYTGYAFGMGIERIAMLKYKINDIRLLYENNVRFLRQF
jgi:phenylalanyl-tRNA synthetase alpha chain